MYLGIQVNYRRGSGTNAKRDLAPGSFFTASGNDWKFNKS